MNGDLIAFSGANPTSDFINLVTWGIPRFSASHVGIVGEYHGQKLLFESTGLTNLPCVITGQRIAGVQAQYLDTRVASYVGKAWHYPLYRPLYEAEAARLNDFLISKIGTKYDTIGAFRSKFALTSLLHENDFRELFCSEYAAAALADVGLLQTANSSSWNPNHLFRYCRWKGIIRRPVRLK